MITIKFAEYTCKYFFKTTDSKQYKIIYDKRIVLIIFFNFSHQHYFSILLGNKSYFVVNIIVRILLFKYYLLAKSTLHWLNLITTEMARFILPKEMIKKSPVKISIIISLFVLEKMDVKNITWLVILVVSHPIFELESVQK